MCLSLASSAPEQSRSQHQDRRGRWGGGWIALAANPLRWPSLLLLGLIQIYRAGLSRWTFPTCRFTPTCSRYALDAVRRYGVLRGGALASWRILRCNPWNKGGFDPVP